MALLWSLLLWSTAFTFRYLTKEWAPHGAPSTLRDRLESSKRRDGITRIHDTASDKNTSQRMGQQGIADKKATNAKDSIKANDESLQDLAKNFYEHHLSSITTMVNESTALIWNAQSKTNPFGPFKDPFENNTQIVPWDVPVGFEPQLHNSSNHYLLWRDICTAAKTLNKLRKRSDYQSFPLIHLLRFHENLGEFSEYVPNRTTAELGYENLVGERVWKNKGCSRQDILEYMDHKDTRALVTTQHSLLGHPKIYCLPLGVKSQYDLNMLMRELVRGPTTAGTKSLPIRNADHHHDGTDDRPQLLMINSRPRKMRLQVLDMVIHNLQALGVKNTYSPKAGYVSYLREMRQSKFILSPSGLGMDCYRHWEAILMGTIPVLEHLNREDAWYRTLADLPVAWVDNYENLTEDFLEAEYRRIMRNSKTYNYHKLTKQWWIQTIKSTLSL